MTTISAIQAKLQKFNSLARDASTDDIQATWKKLFGMQMSKMSANAFVDYYRNMRSKSRKMRGGFAPLNYQMTPGMDVNTYGRFPVDISTDPSSIRDLDVYFRDCITAGCGKEAALWPSPGPTMGSNKVGGGSRRPRGYRHKKSIRKHRGGAAGKKHRKQTLRRHRGGANLLDSIGLRPFIATNPANTPQIGVESYFGKSDLIPSSDPVKHTWQNYTNPSLMAYNPGNVTSIGSDFSKLASPPAWQSV